MAATALSMADEPSFSGSPGSRDRARSHRDSSSRSTSSSASRQNCSATWGSCSPPARRQMTSTAYAAPPPPPPPSQSAHGLLARAWVRALTGAHSGGFRRHPSRVPSTRAAGRLAASRPPSRVVLGRPGLLAAVLNLRASGVTEICGMGGAHLPVGDRRTNRDASAEAGDEQDLAGFAGEEVDGGVDFPERHPVGDEPLEVESAGVYE